MDTQPNNPAPTQTVTTSPGAVPQWEQILKKDGFYVTHTLFGDDAAISRNYNDFFFPLFTCQLVAIGASVFNAASTDAEAWVTKRLADGTGRTAPAITSFVLGSLAETPDWRYGTDLAQTPYSSDGLPLTIFERGDSISLAIKTAVPSSTSNLVIVAYFIPVNRGDYKTP